MTSKEQLQEDLEYLSNYYHNKEMRLAFEVREVMEMSDESIHIKAEYQREFDFKKMYCNHRDELGKLCDCADCRDPRFENVRRDWFGEGEDNE